MAILIPNPPQNIEVIAPRTNAIVVYPYFILSTQTNTIAPIKIMKIEQILYSEMINYEAPYWMIAPIYTIPGC